MDKKIGLIAGNGRLPVLFAEEAQSQEWELVTIAVTPNAQVGRLSELSAKLHQVDVGQLGELIEILLAEDIDEIVMLGKVTKELLYQGIEIDSHFMNLLGSLEERNDDAIMRALVDEFNQAGIKVKSQNDLIDDLFPEAGLLTTTDPRQIIIDDMEYGFKMAKKIADLDIGQTVVVKDKAVMAVEAIEGTDGAILRGGKLARKKAVVAKVSKPRQDVRFDIPTIGPETIENLIKIDAAGLAIEAGKVFVINQEEVVKRAEENDIVIMALQNN